MSPPGTSAESGLLTVRSGTDLHIKRAMEKLIETFC